MSVQDDWGCSYGNVAWGNGSTHGIISRIDGVDVELKTPVRVAASQSAPPATPTPSLPPALPPPYPTSVVTYQVIIQCPTVPSTHQPTQQPVQQREPNRNYQPQHSTTTIPTPTPDVLDRFTDSANAPRSSIVRW